MPARSAPGLSYRILKNQFIGVQTFSNVAASFRAIFCILYDDGSSDSTTIDATTAATWTSELWVAGGRTPWSAQQDGYVVDGFVIGRGTALLRGQTYSLAYVFDGPPTADTIRQRLWRGWQYGVTGPIGLGDLAEITDPSWPAGVTYAFDATYTQGNLAASDVVVDFSPAAGNEYIIVDYRILAGTFAAGRVTQVQRMDTSSVLLRLLENATLTTGQQLFGPSLSVDSATATSTVATIGMAPAMQIVSGTDKLRFNANALAQNETVRIKLRFRIKGAIPTRTNVTAGVTEAINNTENNLL